MAKKYKYDFYYRTMKFYINGEVITRFSNLALLPTDKAINFFDVYNQENLSDFVRKLTTYTEYWSDKTLFKHRQYIYKDSNFFKRIYLSDINSAHIEFRFKVADAPSIKTLESFNTEDVIQYLRERGMTKI